MNLTARPQSNGRKTFRRSHHTPLLKMPANVQSIKVAAYSAQAEDLKHIYMVGSLRRPVPHPFFRDERAEVILCFYKKGDGGLFHWHPEVTEYEFVIEGRMGYHSVSDGREHWFEAGDMICIPAGICVRRLVPTRVRTLTVKVPSRDDKIHCRRCVRVCPCRVEKAEGA